VWSWLSYGLLFFGLTAAVILAGCGNEALSHLAIR
jgi:hypothetical protein